MPKEVVISTESYSSDEPTQEILAEVRWSREGDYVQLATLRVEMGDRSPVRDEVEGGWYLSMNRRSINAMIRHLRRARDQAFGRDE